MEMNCNYLCYIDTKCKTFYFYKILLIFSTKTNSKTVLPPKEIIQKNLPKKILGS